MSPDGSALLQRPPRVEAADLRIRHAVVGDCEAEHRIMSGPQAYAGTLQLPFPSLDLRRESWAKVDPNGARLVAEVRDPVRDGDAHTVVGIVGLEPVNPSLRRRHAMSIGMAVEDAWQGRGIGSALMGAVLDRADNWMNVQRIELTVFVDNDAACALYRRHGFVIEGLHRAYALRDGAYVDAYAMARLHPRPPVLPVTFEERVR